MMDKEYIRMCDTPEVQERWEPKMGDWILRKFTVFGEPLDSELWLDDKQKEDLVVLHYHSTEASQFWGAADKDGKQRTVSFDDSNSMVKATHVFLPRIEDLIEWIGEGIHRITQSPNAKRPWHIEIYKEGVNAPFLIEGKTFIQTLLETLMYCEHSKTWDGEKWR